MKHSLKKRYCIVGSLLIVGFLFVLFVAAMAFKNPLLLMTNRWTMDQISIRVIKEGSEDGNWETAKESIEDLAYEKNVEIAVAEYDFRVILSTMSREEKRGVLNDIASDKIGEHQAELEEKGAFFFGHFTENNQMQLMFVRETEEVYIIIRKSISGLNSSLMVLEISFLFAALLLILLGVPLIVFLVEKMVAPILEINKVTRKMANLDFEEKVPVRSEDELGLLAVSVNDLSDKLKDSIEKLQADVELRKELVRNMAHELKTPVAVILGYAESMRDILERNPERAKKYCRVISDECERMNQIVQQMLEISFYEKSVQKMEFQVQDFLEQVQEHFENEFSDLGTILIRKEETLDTIYGDPSALQRALYNYVKNAVFYGKKGGTITLSVWEEREHVFFSVENEGSHIEESEQEKIWDAFYKVDQARCRNENRSGVGLSIVKAVVEAHGGEVDVKNTEEGVIFSFYISKK